MWDLGQSTKSLFCADHPAIPEDCTLYSIPAPSRADPVGSLGLNFPFIGTRLGTGSPYRNKEGRERGGLGSLPPPAPPTKRPQLRVFPEAHLPARAVPRQELGSAPLSPARASRAQTAPFPDPRLGIAAPRAPPRAPPRRVRDSARCPGAPGLRAPRPSAS